MSMRWWTENSLKAKPAWRTAGGLLLAATVAISSGCSLLPDEAAEEAIPTIQPPKISQKPEYAVTTDTIETRVTGVGKVMSEREEALFFTESGLRVKGVYVNTGDPVTEGQLIAELDAQELSNELRDKQLAFRERELQMKLDLRDSTLSETELESRKISFEQARTDIVELQEKIARTQILAPFDGTIVQLNVSPGDTVNAYDTVAVIADLNQLTIAAKFGNSDLEKVAIGMETDVDINGLGNFKGKVARLPSAQEEQPNDPWNPAPPKQESIDDFLLVDTDEPVEGLVRGTPLSVAVIIDRTENAVVIPPAALRTYGGRTYVQVVEEDGTKREVDVRVGQQLSTKVEILEGLEPGQKVVGR